jgi:hypothetical protein
MTDNPPFEPEPPVESGTNATITRVSDGVNFEAARNVTIGCDVVGRDKIVTTYGYTVEQVSTILRLFSIKSTIQTQR